jgi:hypothetical protein
LIIKLAGEFRTEPKSKKIRIPEMPPVADGIPWGFFDGAIPPPYAVLELFYTFLKPITSP